MTADDRQGDAAASFEPLRPRLVRVAYRMLGSMADAEDIAQEAFLRWMNSDRALIRTPEAFLRRVVTRLCLDQLKSAAHRRETYVGPWLPEPIVDTEEDQADDISLPLMLALERLSPLERAAFLLHDVFGMDFGEVADAVGRDPAACRQLASRARAHVRDSRPRFPVAKERGLEIAEAFFTASRTGDLQGLRAMLADDVVMQSDGGGKRPAARWPYSGIEEVLRVHKGLARLFYEGKSKMLRYGLINGLPGFVTLEADGQIQTTALQIEDDRVTGIYVVRNPDKLMRLGQALLH